MFLSHYPHQRRGLFGSLCYSIWVCLLLHLGLFVTWQKKYKNLTSLFVCLCVCLFVCLSAHFQPKPLNRSFWNFQRLMSPILRRSRVEVLKNLVDQKGLHRPIGQFEPNFLKPSHFLQLIWNLTKICMVPHWIGKPTIFEVTRSKVISRSNF